jgi:hypothetical protein
MRKNRTRGILLDIAPDVSKFNNAEVQGQAVKSEFIILYFSILLHCIVK